MVDLQEKGKRVLRLGKGKNGAYVGMLSGEKTPCNVWGWKTGLGFDRGSTSGKGSGIVEVEGDVETCVVVWEAGKFTDGFEESI